MIPLVAASERGRAQTDESSDSLGLKDLPGLKPRSYQPICEQNSLERLAIEGDSPVSEAVRLLAGT